MRTILPHKTEIECPPWCDDAGTEHTTHRQYIGSVMVDDRGQTVLAVCLEAETPESTPDVVLSLGLMERTAELRLDVAKSDRLAEWLEEASGLALTRMVSTEKRARRGRRR